MSVRWLAGKPTVVNLLANDVCNSRCVTCNIWKKPPLDHLSPDDLARILADPLFRRVRYVGVSGGEPTLRADLPDVFSSVVDSLPAIRGAGVITNALGANSTIGRIVECASVCQAADVAFNVMVSLDGVGETHDTIRGKIGSFESAVKVIRFLRDETSIPVRVGCTISKKNVWQVPEVLEFCRSENVEVRFRIAEFIQRLDNLELTGDIRNFSREESYHLALFFYQLEAVEEDQEIVRWTYRNIRRMLWEGNPRSVKCPAQTTAVTLSSKGELLYCAPRSPVLGNTGRDSALAIYRRNLKTRRRIVLDHCDNCIHDYHAEPKLREGILRINREYWRTRLSLGKVVSRNESGPRYSRLRASADDRRVLITGWYGTETAGDKAILGQIVHELREADPRGKIVVSSINPFYSMHTVSELGLKNVEVVRTHSRDFFDQIDRSDEVIMGGGPLMHIDDLGFVLAAFRRARRNRARTRVWGCGIGPLHRGECYRTAVREILNLSDSIEVRDSRSAEAVGELTGRTDVRVIGDPAERYVERWLRALSGEVDRTATLALCLREWPLNYAQGLGRTQYSAKRADFEMQLGRLVESLCGRFHLQPLPIPMHHFCVGGDDRIFNWRFFRDRLPQYTCHDPWRPWPLHLILASIMSAKMVLCMRFHSVVFAVTLKVPFMAIDYTNGGKITGFLADRGLLDRCLTLDEVAGGHWKQNDFDNILAFSEKR
jgi:MoaA/NifB/PqqE/SkfB family radical SAM enzyme/polysaccharide pyruvyl transferase WcaK-like protein